MSGTSLTQTVRAENLYRECIDASLKETYRGSSAWISDNVEDDLAQIATEPSVHDATDGCVHHAMDEQLGGTDDG